MNGTVNEYIPEVAAVIMNNIAIDHPQHFLHSGRDFLLGGNGLLLTTSYHLIRVKKR